VDNYSFQYLPPNASHKMIEEAYLLHHQLIGNVNILSNKPKWTLYAEARKGNIGGMVSTIPSKFYYFPSDHNAMITPITWKLYLVQDFAKLKRRLYSA
jgi:hypothetical protein